MRGARYTLDALWVETRARSSRLSFQDPPLITIPCSLCRRGILVPADYLGERDRYGTPEDLHGCEHNWFCEHSDIPIFLDLNVKVWRKTRYSLLKCARCSISDWRRR